MQALTFMELLMDKSMNENLTWAEGDTTCPIYQEDVTVDEQARAGFWFFSSPWQIRVMNDNL